ncbi:hypothetical protein TNCV_2790791 [Trichonephila clavipes]|nr:hypothetical protein TNCV_2790791 [Trichonephila clavipes]
MSEIQGQGIVTVIVRSCGRVGHSTADSDKRRIVGRVQTNQVCWLSHQKRRRSVFGDLPLQPPTSHTPTISGALRRNPRD